MLKRITALSFGFLASALLAELFLSALPVATGYHYQAMNDANPVLRGAAHSPYVYSLGWNFRRARRGTLNNEGFPATYDYHRGSHPPVLIVGDSYVQAAAVTAGKRMHELLTARQVPVETIALSRPGGSLPDYLSMVEWGVTRYQPRAVVVLIVLGDVDDSLADKPGGYHFALSPKGFELRRRDRAPLSPFRQTLNESMLIRYAYDNLGLYARLARTVQSTPADHGIEQRTSEFFLAELARIVPADRTILIFHRGRQQRSFEYQADIDALLMAARERGVRSIDLAPEFTAYEARNGRRVDEFPVDTHWNELAHAYVAERLVEVLRTMPDK
jgi:hypothetical protein